MPARRRDAAAEDQRAAAIVQKSLAGGLHAEATRLASVLVAPDSDVRGPVGPLPQLRLFPTRIDGRRPKEEHVGLRRHVRTSQHFFKLIEACARARALR